MPSNPCPRLASQSGQSSLRAARRSHHLEEHAGEAVFHQAAIPRETRASLSRTRPTKDQRVPSSAQRIVHLSKNGLEGQIPKEIDSLGLLTASRDARRQSHGCFSCFRPPEPVKRAKDGIHRASLNGDSDAIKPSKGTSKAYNLMARPANRCSCGRRTTHNPQISVTFNQDSTQTISHASRISGFQPVSAACRPSRSKSTHDTITLIKPQPAPPRAVASMASALAKTSPINLALKPRSALPVCIKSSRKSTSSPPMNISKPQPAEDFACFTRKTTTPMSFKTSREEAALRIGCSQSPGPMACLNKGMKPVVPSKELQLKKDMASCRSKLDLAPLHRERPRVIWREGLLQRLGRIHGLGNCKLSLEELMELDDSSFHDELHSMPQELALPPAIQAPLSTARASMASTWKMEFEGGRPILPLQKEDVKPQELVKSVWPLSHTNSLFEPSRSHHGNYNNEECR